MSRRRDYRKDYEIFTRLVTGNFNQKQIAEKMGIGKDAVSKRVKRLIEEGVLIERIRSSINIYKRGPAAKAFIEKAQGYIDTGGNVPCSITTPPPGRIAQDKPPVEHWQGKAPRTHNLQFLCRLIRPPPSGRVEWKPPELPGEIDWGVETPSGNNPWYTKGNTEHRLGELALPGWTKPAKVHYSHGKHSGEKIQIKLPATYLLADWLKDLDSAEEYFFALAGDIAALFQKAGWETGVVEKTGRGFEYGFYIPLLEYMRDKGAFKVSDTVWVDFSPTDSQGKRPEAETNDPRKDDIPGAWEAFLHLPDLEDAIYKAINATTENRKDIVGLREEVAEMKTVLAEVSGAMKEFSEVAKEMKDVGEVAKEMREVLALVKERVRPEDPEAKRVMYG